jgi:hypothetical protein
MNFDPLKKAVRGHLSASFELPSPSSLRGASTAGFNAAQQIPALRKYRGFRAAGARGAK